MNTGVLDVGRKKGIDVPSEGEGPRPIAIAVRGHPEWKEWVERLRTFAARKLGIPLSLNSLVGLALATYAKSIGFKEGPPER